MAPAGTTALRRLSGRRVFFASSGTESEQRWLRWSAPRDEFVAAVERAAADFHAGTTNSPLTPEVASSTRVAPVPDSAFLPGAARERLGRA